MGSFIYNIYYIIYIIFFYLYIIWNISYKKVNWNEKIKIEKK